MTIHQFVLPGEDPDDEKYTDLVAAQRLAGVFGSRIRYLRDTDKWWGFRGEKWEQISVAEVRAMAVYVGQTSAKGMGNTITAASALEQLHAKLVDFDNNPYLWNCTNGTLNLHPDWRGFNEHDPEDMLTQVCGTAYDANALSPTWDQFLVDVQPDPAVRWYLQKLIGYAMIGTQSEAIFPVLYGDGANGKSTFVEVVATLFGNYGVVAEKSLFKVTRNEPHPADRKRLVKARLARSEELPDVELDEPKIKGLTGGDSFSGRGMRENFEEWQPTHTFLVHSNTKPRISGTDDGIWRRIVLIPFYVKITEAKADKHLKDKLKAELPGILNWALWGLLGYQSEGLRKPESLLKAVADYRAISDTVSSFVDQYESDEDGFEFGLYQEHRIYAESMGLDRAETARNWLAVTRQLGAMGGETKVKHNTVTGKTERGWAGVTRRSQLMPALDLKKLHGTVDI